MSCSIFVFDACTVINLLHIDEDDILFTEIQKHQIYIAEEVINEIKKNAFKKYSMLDTFQISYEHEKIEDIKYKISKLIRYQVLNDTIIKDLGTLCAENKDFNANYFKMNGEYFSSCLALLKCREENHLAIFYSDDYPATKKYQKYFEYQSIGFIQDSVDLLMFLYWTSKSINKIKLKKFLSSLYSEYAIELRLLLEQIRSRRPNIQKIYKDGKLLSILLRLERSLSELQFHELNIIKSDLLVYKTKVPDLIKILESLGKLFEVHDQKQSDLFIKIKNTKDWINKYEVLKLN